ncbi:hypothetical protein BOC40_11710 [Burkholderia pseudomallei]|uniref:hypothetical protein n=1 Tax=Burkholderia pseudomallei TaxID=28450 RepID=UPI000A1A021C|nr:hypothetical protein [Burkholderia pseudomallei]ARK80991.1 hypothetical protein BOC40_11710 [Burkholderia pseudomallei]ARL45427.1 hypothetical protein BOC50_20170 [Burkholderia pseudomallei]
MNSDFGKITDENRRDIEEIRKALKGNGFVPQIQSNRGPARKKTMSNLALHVKSLIDDPSYGRALEADFRRECLVVCSARLIAGEYVLDEKPALPGA